MQGIARAIVDQLGYHVSILVVLAIGVYQGIQVKTFILEIPGFLIQIVTVEAIPATVTFSIVLLVSGILLLLDTLQADIDTKTPNTTPLLWRLFQRTKPTMSSTTALNPSNNRPTHVWRLLS